MFRSLEKPPSVWSYDRVRSIYTNEIFHSYTSSQMGHRKDRPVMGVEVNWNNDKESKEIRSEQQVGQISRR